MFTLISLAIHYSPWFSWAKNALSDLGVKGLAAVIFNSALMIGGVLTFVFAVGLREALSNGVLGKVGSFLLVLDAVALFLIGVFPETAGVIHLYVSLAFFVLLPTSLLLIGAAMVRIFNAKLGLFTIATGLAAIVVWMLPYDGGVAIPEALASAVACVWIVVLGVKLYTPASR